MSYVQNSNFYVQFGGRKFSFSKVSNISVNFPSQTLAEGGVNHMVHSLYMPQSEEKTLRLERGSTTKSPQDDDFLQDLKGAVRFPTALVVVNDETGRACKWYSFANLRVKSWSVGDLDAMDGHILIESLEFTYDYMEEVTR